MDNKHTAGVLYALSAYLIWGVLAAYWMLFKGVPEIEIMAHRIFWAFFISLAALVLRKQASELKSVFFDRRSFLNIIFRAFLIAVNWYTYVWGLGNGYVLEASLGYYLNPLVSIFLGLIFLNERLSRLQWAAVGFAVLGVALKTVLVGRFPFIAVTLAFTFGIYGLLKKKSIESSLAGIAAEMLILLPFAAAFIIFSELTGSGNFTAGTPWTKFLLFSTGVITIVPFFLFAQGAGRIPLVWLGFLQFIAPTLMMLFGIFLYHEHMSVYELAGFIAVWIGMTVFIVASGREKK